MRHVHVKAEPCARGFKSVIEVCNDGVRLFKMEGGRYSKSLAEAEAYAKKLGAEFLTDTARAS